MSTAPAIAEGREIHVGRFTLNRDGEPTITGSGGGTTYTVSTDDDTKTNGDIVTGLTPYTDVTIYDTSTGKTTSTTMGALRSSWNTGDASEMLLLRLNNGAQGNFTLGQEDYVTLPFSTAEPVEFHIGDYVDLALALDEAQGNQFAKRYEVVEPPKPAFNTTTGGYDYELKLEAYYMAWKNKIFRYITQDSVEQGETAQGEASWSMTATLETQMTVFLKNLRSLNYTFGAGKEDFVCEIDGDWVDSAKALLCQFDNTSLVDALTTMAETWDCEWWVTENVIHFGRCENSDYVQIGIGREAEQMTRSDSSGTFATRIYAFGADRNLQSNYRETGDEVLVNGVVQRRLMLPPEVPYVDAWRYATSGWASGRKMYTTLRKEYTDEGGVLHTLYLGDAGWDDLDVTPKIIGYVVDVAEDEDGKVTLTKTYVDNDTYSAGEEMTVHEAIEAVVTTDDIYPRTDDEVTAVSVYWKMFDPSLESDEGTLVYDDQYSQYTEAYPDGFDPSAYTLTGSQYLVPYYRIKSKFFDEQFKYAYIITGETLGLTFNSGRLNGMEFELMFLGEKGNTDTEYTSGDG
ncbi:MAG: hypothetical protein LUC33_05810, partial [Prevotellaceae bacterium]|nr:hypothetical protein [Prevotellaceae bacterium]